MPRQLSLFGEPTPPAVAPATVAPALAELAGQLPQRIRLGTSSWSFPGWAGAVYARAEAQTRLARDGLAAYARHPLLRAVGIDRTYYGPIEAADFAAYAAAVPDDFRFLVKAHELCTVARFPAHDRYGAQRGQANAFHLDAGYARDRVVAPAVEGLGSKAGPLLFQFPPQDPRSVGGAEHFAERLHSFLRALPRGPHYAVELRSPTLLGRAYFDALADAGASHCLNVHPTMPDVTVQAEAAGAQSAPAVVVRWMLHRGYSYDAARDHYAPFDRLVDEDVASREAIAAVCVAARAPAYVIINNKAEGSAPLSAFKLAESIARRVGGKP